MVSERTKGPRRTDLECKRIKTILLEPRLLAEAKITNEVDEEILKNESKSDIVYKDAIRTRVKTICCCGVLCQLCRKNFASERCIAK